MAGTVVPRIPSRPKARAAPAPCQPCDCVTVPLVLVAFRTTAVAFSLRRSVYFSAWQTEPCRVRMSVGAPHGTELGGRYGPVNPRELRY